MSLVTLILAAVVALASGACGSKVQTRRKIEATEGSEANAEGQKRSTYRTWEGSPGQSSEEAASQLGGY